MLSISFLPAFLSSVSLLFVQSIVIPVPTTQQWQKTVWVLLTHYQQKVAQYGFPPYGSDDVLRLLQAKSNWLLPTCTCFGFHSLPTMGKFLTQCICISYSGS
jgi:hypothetical protein